MNEMVSDKNKLEKDLFGQFIPILQSKHDKIQALEDEIGRLRASGSSESKEKDDDYGSDTDMDDEPVQQNDSLNILGIWTITNNLFYSRLVHSRFFMTLLKVQTMP